MCPRPLHMKPEIVKILGQLRGIEAIDPTKDFQNIRPQVKRPDTHEVWPETVTRPSAISAGSPFPAHAQPARYPHPQPARQYASTEPSTPSTVPSTPSTPSTPGPKPGDRNARSDTGAVQGECVRRCLLSDHSIEPQTARLRNAISDHTRRQASRKVRT